MSDLLGVIQNLGRRILAVEQALPSTPRWAEVTQLTPLRVRLDGDLSALEVTPENLAGALELGQRVLVHIYGRRAVVYGPVTVSGGDVYQVGEPVGTMYYTFALTTDPAPAGCLWLEGGTASRTTYPELFAHWGTRFGVGDGVNTFGLPDFKGKVPAGWNSTGVFNVTPGSTVGSETVTLTEAQMPIHTHNVLTRAGNPAGTLVSTDNASTRLTRTWDTVARNDRSDPYTAAAGSGQPHPNVQTSLVGRWCVRASAVTTAPAGSLAATPATANTVALRDSAGRFQVASPAVLQDAANKQYVDRERVPPFVSGYMNTITANAYVAMVLEDSDGFAAPPNNTTIVIPYDGLYAIDVGQLVRPSSLGTYYQLRINNSTVRHSYAEQTTHKEFVINYKGRLLAGDTVRFYWQGALPTGHWSTPHSWVSVVRL